MYLSLVKSVSLLEFYQLCFVKYFKNAVYGMSYYTLASIASPKKPMFGHIARPGKGKNEGEKKFTLHHKENKSHNSELTQ